MTGSILLSEVAARTDHLDVACNRVGPAGLRCPRHSRLRIDKLIAEHGADLPIPRLRQIISADCPRWTQSVSMTDLCGVHFPQLPGLFLNSL